MPVPLLPGSQESSWLRVQELSVFSLGTSSFILYKSEIKMPQFFLKLFEYYGSYLQASNSTGHILYSVLTEVNSLFISERAGFSLTDLNKRSGPVVKPKFNNYYYFKLGIYFKHKTSCHVGPISAIDKHRPNT